METVRPLAPVLILVFTAGSLTGQTDASQHVATGDPLRDCVETLVVPQFPVTSRAAGNRGKAEVLLTWGPGGKLEVLIEASSKDFEHAVADSLKDSRFSRECRNCKLRLVFEFELDLRRSHLLRQQVKFVPPSTFRVVANLMALNP